MNTDDFWKGIFGRSAPIEIEVGAGRGAFLFAAASAAPGSNFLAIEHSHSRALQLERDATARGLTNVRVLRADAACVVAAIIPDVSVAAYHVYFPDPWWKRRHHRRRLFTPAFVNALHRTLVPGGCVRIATDVPEYFALVTRLLSAHFARESDTPPFSTPTRFAQKAGRRGAPIHVASFTKPTAEAAA
ncbi:MAG TPA: tRNA (guanosine(46)-N7)-methyltransferase TrmB [Candidatus Kryptonia bacterium]|nr:tRNA (guanosine(46)-N7)-methyltransferase TrmB [Candidatus Kryptonia bacterium]